MQIAINKVLRRLTSVGLLLGIPLVPRLGHATIPLSSVTLAWTPSPSSNIAGYNVYYGVSSGAYTNFISVSNTNKATIANLAGGTTYYFAARAVDLNGIVGSASQELAFTVGSTTLPVRVQLSRNSGQLPTLSAFGPASYQYNVLAGSGLTNWKSIGTMTLDSTGAGQFTDSGATTGLRLYRLQQVYP